MILGIDAGGSNSRVITAEYGVDNAPTLRCERMLGPGNFRHLGRSGTAALVREVMQICAIDQPQDWSVLGGFAGAGTDRSRQDIRTLFESQGFRANRIHITNDAGLLLDAIGEGIVLIAGTGSVCMGRTGRPDDGLVEVRSGGYGFRMPSEIGGYYLGIQAIDIALQVADGRQQETSSLHQLVMDHLDLKSPAEITPLLYPEEGGAGVQETVATLAPVVLKAAADGDAAATALVGRMVDGLADHLISVHEKLGIDAAAVALHGGLFRDPLAPDLLIKPLRHHPLIIGRSLQFCTFDPSSKDPDPLLAAMGQFLRAH